jgi:hypothetical protein
VCLSHRRRPNPVNSQEELTLFCLWQRRKIGFSEVENVSLCLESNDANRDVWKPVYFDCETVIQKEIYCLAVILWTATVITGAI